MSIFTKPLSQLSAADLKELLDENAVENSRLEFKLEIPTKDETLKKLSSFANTFGGFIVIGAKASSADGRIEGLHGVDTQSGYKQTIMQWCFSAVSPPLIAEVSDPIPSPENDRKFCYVIHIAESDVAPHFLNARKGIYVRTDEFSSRFEARLTNENELRHLLDRRKLIRDRRTNLLERAKKRFDTFAARTHTDSSGIRTKMGSLLELCVVPRFPAQQVCEQGKLNALIVENVMPWRQVTFPNIANNGIISQHESAIVLNPIRGFSIFESNVWGMLFYCTQIDGNHNGNSGIHLYQLVGRVLLFVRHAGKMLTAMGYSGPILIETTLRYMLNVVWLYDLHGQVHSRQGSELDDDIAFSINTTSEELREKSDAIAMDILRYVFFSVNSSDLIDKPLDFEMLIRKGYMYNIWSDPAKLQI
jgi:hypothetical protein